jgi:hypothetical protein
MGRDRATVRRRVRSSPGVRLTMQLSLFCGHVFRGAHLGVRKARRCILPPGHYGVHDDGGLSWMVGAKFADWRGRKVGG